MVIPLPNNIWTKFLLSLKMKEQANTSALGIYGILYKWEMNSLD